MSCALRILTTGTGASGHAAAISGKIFVRDCVPENEDASVEKLRDDRKQPIRGNGTHGPIAMPGISFATLLVVPGRSIVPPCRNRGYAPDISDRWINSSEMILLIVF